MINPEDMAAMLAETYWRRPANQAEVVAMAGEIRRDSTWVGAQTDSADNRFFTVEPAHFDALMRKDIQ